MNKVLIGRTLINLDTGLVIRWEASELGYTAATIFNPLATGAAADRAGYQLDKQGSDALWTAMTFESGRKALGILCLEAGE